MEPRLLTAVVCASLFVLYMLVNLGYFWHQLDEIRDKTEKQDRLRGRYSGYKGLGGLTVMLRSGGRRHPKRPGGYHLR